jgi:rfaE bifunctional protein nucleotidyltransferase chain/domain
MTNYKPIHISFEDKILTPTELLIKLQQNKTNTKIVFTNGCFDIIHRGHVSYLAEAKSLGDKLIVALNTDESVKQLNKGEDRPINNLTNRCAVIAALESVDYVTYFSDNTPLELINLFQPNILVKGGDWQLEQIIGYNEVKSWGGEVYSIPFRHQTSTTNIINKINKR